MARNRMTRKGSRAGELGEYHGPLTSKIFLRVPDNPKVHGSQAHRRFNLIRDEMTVAEYYIVCQAVGENPKYARQDIEWNLDRKFIRLD